MSTRRMLIPLAAGLVALAVPSGASAAVTNVQFGFCTTSCLETTTTGKAGANVNYHFEFTVPSGFDGGSGPNGDGSQSFTIDGSAGRAPGTVFPTSTSNYQIGYGTGGYSVNPFRSGAVVVSNGGETLTITPFNGSLDVGPGETMELDIFGNSTTNGCTVGGGKFFSVSTSADAAANSNNFSLVTGDPAALSPSDGNNQSTPVETAFDEPLQVNLVDSCGNDISGKDVSFTAPEDGASGSFAAGTSTTDADGLASSPELTANTVAGSWQADASVSGGSNPSTSFDLTNDPGPVDQVHLGLSPDTIIADGFSTTTATLRAEDEHDNPVSGIDTSFIDFTTQDLGQAVGATNDAGGGDYTATITSSTTPGDSLITGTFDDGGTPLQDSETLHQTADLVAPVATINIGPGAKTKDRTPTIYFSADEDEASFECKLDSDGYDACDSPHTTSKLSVGKHTFRVRAEDLSGNVGSPDKLGFKVVKKR